MTKGINLAVETTLNAVAGYAKGLQNLSISAVNTMDHRRLGLTIFLWNTLFQKSGTQIHI